MKIFFDLDGTLIDVAPRHYKVYAEVVIQFGGIPLTQQEYWELKRKKTKWPELLPLSGLDPAVEPDFLQAFINKIEDKSYLKIDQVFPGVMATLERVGRVNDCYLVSLRRKHQNLLEQVAWLGLTPHFKKVLSGHSESDGYDKKIELIRSELDGNKGVIVGDTEADIVTGRQLGLRTIAVLSGIRDGRFLAELQPDFLVDNIVVAASILAAEDESI